MLIIPVPLLLLIVFYFSVREWIVKRIDHVIAFLLLFSPACSFSGRWNCICEICLSLDFFAPTQVVKLHFEHADALFHGAADVAIVVQVSVHHF